jgi:hypothetical protein
VTYRYAARTVFILGAPRSGTTWLGKIFDSHPDVIYRHEPDIVNRNDTLPFLSEPEQTAFFVENAQAWLNDLAAISVTRTAGSQPVFGKSFHTPFQSGVRSLLIKALKGAEKIPGLSRLAQAVPIPDFVDLDSNAYAKLVIKSNSSMGRARILAAAAPDSRFVLILRHPCGQVSSMMRGVEESHFEHKIPILPLSHAPQARRRGLTAERLGQLPFFEQLTWNWVINNENALEALAGAKHVLVMRYEDLTDDPEATGKRIFEFCGLEWRAENSAYLVDSARATGHETYYELKRNPVEAANKWRKYWSQDEVDAISEIVTQSQPGRMFMTTDDRRESAGA